MCITWTKNLKKKKWIYGGGEGIDKNKLELPIYIENQFIPFLAQDTETQLRTAQQSAVKNPYVSRTLQKIHMRNHMSKWYQKNMKEISEISEATHQTLHLKHSETFLYFPVTIYLEPTDH